MRARPSGMLQGRALMTALSAACAVPQSVTRCLGAPSNYKRYQRHWRVVQTFLAVDPGSSSGCAEAP
jgi:hypothetical protein